ncbi:hypothetical protein [Poritiphilus flavus]|uniref:Uncharacterized protein n=1 Tax=Poritiphilus flavus TaxID=2697053 RepID=A0A6L9E7Q3_9FLAO|nr:hypothetical protein [Poritiphilus flavus]NAS10593.1 hypothetical protein [Poritiphilus flavus]
MMKWTKYQKVLVGLDIIIDALKIIAVLLILYGVILDHKFDLIGKSMSVVLALLSWGISLYLRLNRDNIIKGIIAPVVIPIPYATVVPDGPPENTLTGIVFIQELYVKQDILTVRFLINDDKPCYVHPSVYDHAHKMDFEKANERDIPITPRWKDDTFDMQLINLNDLDLTEAQMNKEIRLVVRLLYTSYFNVGEDHFSKPHRRAKIQAGEFTNPDVWREDTKFFEGSFQSKKFKMYTRKILEKWS